jgi:hypothetical protein
MINITNILTQAEIATGVLVIAAVVLVMALKKHSRQSHK